MGSLWETAPGLISVKELALDLSVGVSALRGAVLKLALEVLTLAFEVLTQARFSTSSDNFSLCKGSTPGVKFSTWFFRVLSGQVIHVRQ